jgi:hypothetical protein
VYDKAVSEFIFYGHAGKNVDLRIAFEVLKIVVGLYRRRTTVWGGEEEVSTTKWSSSNCGQLVIISGLVLWVLLRPMAMIAFKAHCCQN